MVVLPAERPDDASRIDDGRPGDPPLLSTAACRIDGAICLAVDRALLDASIKELVNRNTLTLTVNDLIWNLDSSGTSL